MTLDQSTREAKAHAIREALARHQGNRTRAARDLGITYRHLVRLLTALGFPALPMKALQVAVDPAVRDHARSLASQAIRRGDLQRQPCERCGAAKVDAHHDDYEQPLAVRWLCRPCHQAYHQHGGEL